jgi:flagellar operon protein
VNPALHSPAVLPGAAPAAPPARGPARAPRAPGAPSFGDALREATGGLGFSGHALARVERRGIDVGPATMARLSDGVARAAAKGARESVVLVDDTAFVVSVRNRTVITAVDRAHMRDHVFTNIDSAVVA